MTERDLRDRLAATYHTASKASSGSAHVSIHVGPAVWDGLSEMAKQVGITADEKMELCWGFPIVIHSEWEDDLIKVRTETIIW